MSADTVERRLPGDLAMWFFILAELSVFSLLLLAFAGAQPGSRSCSAPAGGNWTAAGVCC